MNNLKLFIRIIVTFVSSKVIAQDFVNVGGGVSSFVRCFYSDSINGKLYVGGNFKYAANLSVNGIGAWDGVSWSTLGQGELNCDSSSGTCIPIFAVTKFQNEIYVSVTQIIGGVNPNGIARWNGIDWQTVGNGLFDYSGHYGMIGSFYQDSSNLFACGVFDSAGYVHAKSLATWDGNSWAPFLNSESIFTNDPIRFYPLTKYNGEYYVCTTLMDSLGKMLFFAKWNGANWERVQNAFNCTICNISSGIGNMIEYQNELYVGGTFNKLYSAPGNSIAKWDGSNWHELGSGFYYGASMGSIFDMAVYHDELYVVGLFDKVNGIQIGNTAQSGNIAKWDGKKWCTFSYRFDNTISKIAVFNDNIYIGGGFHTIDGDSIPFIAKWEVNNSIDTCTLIGIDEDEFQSELSFYPNPSASSITIDFPHKSQAYTFIISNVFGKRLIEKNISSQTLRKELDISELAAGIYFITLESESGRVTKKFIKQ